MNFDTIWHRYGHRPYKLRVHDHGGNGPVIILLHGIAASSASWTNLIPFLTANYRCITIDLLGFGDSPKPQWNAYTMEDHLRSIHYTIRRLHLRRDYILAGHSLGSLLATAYARRWPRHISRLLLLSPPIYAPLDTITSKLARQRTALFLSLYHFLRTHRRVTPANVKRLGRLVPLPKSIVRNPQTWMPFMRTLEHCIEQQTIIDDLAALQIPVDIFYGTLDKVLVPHNIRIIQQPNVTIQTIRGANHDLGKRYAAVVAKHILTELQPTHS